MSCDHDLDPEYLYPPDAQFLEIFQDAGDTVFRIVLPCPECDQAVEVTARTESVEEADLELPLEDTEDVYD